MKKIIFALIFALFVCASVACVSAAENTNMNTYNNDPSDLVELKGQIDNLEAITGEDYVLDDIIEMNNTATKDGGRIEPNHGADEIQDVELNKGYSYNVLKYLNTHFVNNTAEPGGAIRFAPNHDAGEIQDVELIRRNIAELGISINP